MMPLQLYPLFFKPILKEKIWGGNRLNTFLKKELPNQKIGESWEISDLPGNKSIIDNGKYKGKALGNLLQENPIIILGETQFNKFGTAFPLLIKYIDAQDKLSVQLHPNDNIALQKHQSLGKNEMWYIIHAEKGAHIIAGFNENMDPITFNQLVESNTIEDTLKKIPVKKGDAFFIPTGLIHAIGKGVVLAEIQQPSDITYRIYDYNRLQNDGRSRELHIEEAKEAIDFDLNGESLDYNPLALGRQKLKHSPYFKTNLVQLGSKKIEIKRNSSFTIIMVVEGSGILNYSDDSYELRIGDSCLLPANGYPSIVKGEGLKFLEVYL